MNIIVQGGSLTFSGSTYQCSVGRTGVLPAADKREGDGATPAGSWPLRFVLYRADKLPPPATNVRVQAVARDDGWCDDPADAAYNKQVKYPYRASAERLWRDEDSVYDVLVVLGHNDDPVIPGAGSAIFFHVALPGYIPTSGCVALKLQNLLDVLANCTPTTQLVILP